MPVVQLLGCECQLVMRRFFVFQRRCWLGSAGTLSQVRELPRKSVDDAPEMQQLFRLLGHGLVELFRDPLLVNQLKFQLVDSLL